jgi:hypothetical protein
MTATALLVSKLDFAQEARRRGARVYPLMPNSDAPAFPEADCFASTDEGQVFEWWHENPKRGIGISAEDTLIIRISERCLEQTVQDFAELLKSNAVPLTLRTVRGEYKTSRLEICLFYRLPAGATVAGAQDVFGPGIDVLSTDDVVLGPGPRSRRRGKCEFHGNSMMADANAWLMQMCGVQLPESKVMTNVVPLKRPAAAAPTTAAIKTKLDWALEASEHVPVHPCRWYVDPGPDANPDERKKAISAAKEPLTKWKDLATQDPEQIRKWWGRWPDANIGGVTPNVRAVVVNYD